MMNNKQVPETYLQIGRLGKTFQLSGGLRFYPLGVSETEAIYKLKHIFIEGIGKTDIRDIKESAGNIIVFLTAALSLEKAKLLVNRDVYASPKALPQLDEDEVYVDDLLEQSVYLDGERIGKVEDVIKAGLQDILSVVTNMGNFLVPLQADYVSLADDGIFLEDIPEGLLDLND